MNAPHADPPGVEVRPDLLAEFLNLDWAVAKLRQHYNETLSPFARRDLRAAEPRLDALRARVHRARLGHTEGGAL